MLGPHIINGAAPHLSQLRRWQPKVALFLEPNVADVRAFRQACPNTIVVGRIYRPDSEINDRIRADPEGAAQWAHDLTIKNSAAAQRLVHYVQFANEVCQFWDGLPLLQRFELKRMALADHEKRWKCAIFGFSVGQPDLPAADRLAHWQRTYPAIDYAQKNNHVILVHQYGAPSLWEPNPPGPDWLIHRLEHQVLHRLPYKQVQFIVGEYGIDGLLRPQTLEITDQGGILNWPGLREEDPDARIAQEFAVLGGPSGWKNFTSPTAYVDQLIKMHHYLQAWRDRILGYCIFTLGHNNPWQTYDIAGDVTRMLADFYVSQPAPPPPPPTGDLKTHLLSLADSHQKIQFNVNAALQKRIFADAFVPNSDEFEATYTGVTYVCQRAENLKTGAVRVYYVAKGDWAHVRYFDRPLSPGSV